MNDHGEIDENSLWETDTGEIVTFHDLKVRWEQEHQQRTFFLQALINPLFHWFFIQGKEALEQELYIPGVSALLNGIEASLRVTLRELDPEHEGKVELSPYRLLSNTLIRQARDAGMDISCLAFPGEADFNERVDSKENVRLVQLRHDICHGNILGFVQSYDGPEDLFFTPECLRSTSAILLDLCYDWAVALGSFRREAGLMPPNVAVPNRPNNPLAHWIAPAVKNFGDQKISDSD